MIYDKTQTPEYVYHYTTTEGLHGILRSQTLHASNILYLSDRKELTYVDEFIEKMIEDKFKEVFIDLQSKGIMTERVDLPMLSKYEASNFIESMHRTSSRLSPTFVVSFCRARTEFVEQNGLLSQWRGYGRDGGIALRFEVAGLEAILRAESEKYSLISTFLGDVIYGREDVEFETIRETLNVFSRVVPDIIETMLEKSGNNYQFEGEKASLDDMHIPYSTVAPRLKHPGFAEETEYRLAKTAWKGDRDPDEHKEVKGIYFKTRDNYLLPYVEINEERESRLPIDQIIVGPSREMGRRANSVQALARECGVEAEVLRSAIPFA